MSNLYITKKPRGNTYDMVVAKCQGCLGTEFTQLEDKRVICSNCGKEFKEER